MVQAIRLAQPYRIKATYSEVNEMKQQLETIAKQDGKSGFSVSELKKAKVFLRHHGIKFRMNDASIGTLQETLTSVSKDYKPWKDKFETSFFAGIIGGGYCFFTIYSEHIFN